MSISIRFLILFFCALAGCGRGGERSGGEYTDNTNQGNIPDTLRTGWYRVTDSTAGIARHWRADTVYYLNPEPMLTVADFESLTVDSLPYPAGIEMWQIVARLEKDAGRKFSEATEKLIKKDIVFVLADTLFSTPVRIQAKIPSGVITINRQEFSKTDAEAVITRILQEKQ